MANLRFVIPNNLPTIPCGTMLCFVPEIVVMAND